MSEKSAIWISVFLLLLLTIESKTQTPDTTIELQYEPVDYQGFVPYQQNGKWGYVNFNNEVMLKATLDTAVLGLSNDDRLPLKKGKKIGLLSPGGILKPRKGNLFINNLRLLFYQKPNSKMGIYDEYQQQLLVKAKYDSIGSNAYHMLLLHKDGKQGLSRIGRNYYAKDTLWNILPPVFDSIHVYRSRYCEAFKEGQVSCYAYDSTNNKSTLIDCNSIDPDGKRIKFNYKRNNLLVRLGYGREADPEIVSLEQIMNPEQNSTRVPQSVYVQNDAVDAWVSTYQVRNDFIPEPLIQRMRARAIDLPARRSFPGLYTGALDDNVNYVYWENETKHQLLYLFASNRTYFDLQTPWSLIMAEADQLIQVTLAYRYQAIDRTRLPKDIDLRLHRSNYLGRDSRLLFSYQDQDVAQAVYPSWYQDYHQVWYTFPRKIEKATLVEPKGSPFIQICFPDEPRLAMLVFRQFHTFLSASFLQEDLSYQFYSVNNLGINGTTNNTDGIPEITGVIGEFDQQGKLLYYYRMDGLRFDGQ